MSHQHDSSASSKSLCQVETFRHFMLEQVEFSLILIGGQKILILCYVERRQSEQIKRGFCVGKFASICNLEVKGNIVSCSEWAMRSQ